MVPMPVELSAVKYTTSDEMDAYERLLTDAMKGDQLLFVRQDAVEAAWAIVDPILGDCCPTDRTSRAPGVRPTRESWPPTSVAGMIRNSRSVEKHSPQRHGVLVAGELSQELVG